MSRFVIRYNMLNNSFLVREVSYCLLDTTQAVFFGNEFHYTRIAVFYEMFNQN